MSRLAVLVLVAVVTVCLAAYSSGQSSVFAGGAATFPVGSLTSSGGFASAGTGWQGTIGAQFAVSGSGLSVGPRV